MTRYEKILKNMTPDRLAQLLFLDNSTCEGCAFADLDERAKDKERNEVGCLDGIRKGLMEEADKWAT